MREEEETSLAPSYRIVFLGTGETSAEQSLISKKKKKITSGQERISALHFPVSAQPCWGKENGDPTGAESYLNHLSYWFFRD